MGLVYTVIFLSHILVYLYGSPYILKRIYEMLVVRKLLEGNLARNDTL